MSARIDVSLNAPVGLPDAARLRWQGVLRPDDRDWCRQNGVALAYDPAQAGWIVAPEGGFVDDAPESDAPLSHAAGLGLRPWAAADLPAFHTLLDDPLVWRHMPEPYPAPLTQGMAADLIAVSGMGGHHAVRAVTLAGVPVGQVRIAFEDGSAQAELSYWLGRGFWGRGLGRRMVAKAVVWAFAGHPDLRALTARVRPDNSASARALVAAGFAATGQRNGWDWFSRPR
jgi:RimJ/RimL family protein N-acetyltransferase